MQWAICLVESQLKSMFLSVIEMQYISHHSGTKHSNYNALSLLFTRCMQRSISKTCTLWQEVSYQWESMHDMDCQYWVQLLYTDVSGSWHCTVHSFWYSCCTQLSEGPNIVWYVVSGIAVVHRCQRALALYSM